ncbi:MAG: sodium:proton antiporter [Lachnospiraceae bacterium]|nr:sodium:proton antiporter [Lachnospiraceae bacterium]
MEGRGILLLFLLLPLAGGLLSCALKPAERKFGERGKMISAGVLFVVLAAVFGLSLWAFAAVTKGAEDLTLYVPDVCGYGLNLTVDGFRAVYLTVASFAWLVSGVFYAWYGSHDASALRYQVFTMVTLSCTLGVLLSADLFTLFIFFEGMSLASYVWVAHERTAEAIRASKTYLTVAVIGGMVLLMGIFLLYREAGTLFINNLTLRYYFAENPHTAWAAGLCLLFGFGAKAGGWPLHIWLPKAHPEAPASASALLSGILTKTGVFGIFAVCGRYFLYNADWGRLVFWIGIVTMLVGAVRALGSIDIKHMLACSSVSQIGFILVGIGAAGIMESENAMAVTGSILHMLNHSAFKLILFLCAGIVVHRLHTRDFNKIRGFGRNHYGLMILMLIASLGIAGIPIFSGYVSKTLIHESIVEIYHAGGSGIYKFAEHLFLLAGGCTFAYMVKLFVVLFVREPSPEVQAAELGRGPKDMPRASMVLLFATAFLIFIFGAMPEVSMIPIGRLASDVLPYGTLHHVPEFFGPECLKGFVYTVAYGLLILGVETVLVRRKRVSLRTTPEYVDRMEKLPTLEDNLYRPLLFRVFPAVFGTLMRGLEKFTEYTAIGVLGFCKAVLAVCDKVVDALILLLRRTVLAPVVEQRSITLAEAICNPIGHIGNGFRKLWNLTFGRKSPKEGDCVEAINRARVGIADSVKLVSRSLSYGLMTFCIGLLILMVYLLWSFF